MAVVGASGVVGRVYAVASGASKALLVTDVKSSVAVRLARSREQVLMDGTGGSVCTLRFVHRDTSVEAGEMVVTSGLDGVFPDGIPVGKVKAVRQLETGIFQEVDVELTEPLGRVEDVLIVLSGRTCSDGYVSE
jgi:rod shape-determining protein MreC